LSHRPRWRPCIVSAPSGQITTITLGDGAPDRLVNLYRGRGGTPVWKEASLNGWLVWRVRMLFLEGDRMRSSPMYVYGGRITVLGVCTHSVYVVYVAWARIAEGEIYIIHYWLWSTSFLTTNIDTGRGVCMGSTPNDRREQPAMRQSGTLHSQVPRLENKKERGFNIEHGLSCHPRETRLSPHARTKHRLSNDESDSSES